MALSSIFRWCFIARHVIEQFLVKNFFLKGDDGRPGPPGRQGNNGEKVLAAVLFYLKLCFFFVKKWICLTRCWQGEQGEQGPSGSDGRDGQKGSRGQTGVTGEKGEPGDLVNWNSMFARECKFKYVAKVLVKSHIVLHTQVSVISAMVSDHGIYLICKMFFLSGTSRFSWTSRANRTTGRKGKKFDVGSGSRSEYREASGKFNKRFQFISARTWSFFVY